MDPVVPGSRWRSRAPAPAWAANGPWRRLRRWMSDHRGLKELDSAANEAAGAHDDSGRLRRPGAGRKPLTAHDPNLVQALERLVDPVTRGADGAAAVDLDEHLRRPSGERAYGQPAAAGACKPTARRWKAPSADRCAEAYQPAGARLPGPGQPVVSVDTKKKELVGEYRNGGREWRPKGQPRVKARRQGARQGDLHLRLTGDTG